MSKLSFQSFAQDAPTGEAKLHGGPEEDRQRDEAIAQAKEEFDALLQKWQNRAYEIGGSFRGPGIWAHIKKGIRIP